MISTSSIQQHHSSTRKLFSNQDKKEGASTKQISIQRGPKPLEKKTFYLDVKNYALADKLESRIKELGGAIELFLVKSVSLVITDRRTSLGSDKSVQSPLATPGGCGRNKWGYASGGSGGPPSLTPSFPQTPPTPYCNKSFEGPLSNSTNSAGPKGQTGQKTKSRVDAMLERALIQPQQCSVDPVENAFNWGIPIWTTYEVIAWLDKICASLKDSSNANIKHNNKTANKDIKVRVLKDPFIKFESYHRDTRPVFLELKAWPTLHFNGEVGSCPFLVPKKESGKDKNIKVDIKENKEKLIRKDKEMTRKPRVTTAAHHTKKSENNRYCDICHVDYRNFNKHLQSSQHINFIKDDKNFIQLDNLIHSGTDVDAFLKKNNLQSSNDCSLMANGTHPSNKKVGNGLLHSSGLGQTKSAKSSLNNVNEFQENKASSMVQCNGACKNLDLKFESAHNLRIRTKHESGHLLRSMGTPFENEKDQKSPQKFVITAQSKVVKRSKGTLWIEEDSSDEEAEVKVLDNVVSSNNRDESFVKSKENKNGNSQKSDELKITENGKIKSDYDKLCNDAEQVEEKNCEFELGNCGKLKVNGCENIATIESAKDCGANNESVEKNTEQTNVVKAVEENNGFLDKICENNHIKETYVPAKICRRNGKRGGRSCRGVRQRLSCEERLLEDNKQYYKVEVLGTKLRSSSIPTTNMIIFAAKENLINSNVTEKIEVKKELLEDNLQSPEKRVKLKFKRVRKSELSLLSDEAESFMFPKRNEDSDSDDDEDNEPSILPKDTESSENDKHGNSVELSSSMEKTTSPIKKDNLSESQYSPGRDRSRKKRRTQTEALIKDNTDYYKFETPGSRLRYQMSLSGPAEADDSKCDESNCDNNEIKLYPSKPSETIEKMKFSFEAIPKSEPWYQTYQRQDEGAEYWHYFSEIDIPRPFALPYEFGNYEELIQKRMQRGVHRKRRGKKLCNALRSPRKSPRCHASTLAIMSTIIRRREQQQQSNKLETIREEESNNRKPVINILDKTVAKKAPQIGCSQKSDVDEDLIKIVKSIDDMLNAEDEDILDDDLDLNFLQNPETSAVLKANQVPPKGAPVDLLELIDNCHEAVISNGIENSSCASSECSDLTDLPYKRRKKKRKNKTGWPGKLKRRFASKHLGISVKEEEELVIPSFNVKSEGSESNSKLDFSLANSGKENEITLNVMNNSTDHEMNKKSRGRHKQVKSRSASPKKVRIKKEISDGELEDPYKISSISEDSEASITDDSFQIKEKKPLTPIKSKRKRRRMISNKSWSLKEVRSPSPRKKDLASSTPRKYINKLGSSPSPKKRRLGKEDIKNNIKKNCKKKNIKIEKDLSFSVGSSINKGNKNKVKLKSSKIGKKSDNDDDNTSVMSEVNKSSETGLSNSVTVFSSDVEQRRSNIDFQPVVRVTKIEDEIDISVAVSARLRSSSSPKSVNQPPNKRFKFSSLSSASKGQIYNQRWTKNS